MEPLEQISPSQVKSFFTHLCIASSRHERQYRAKRHAVPGHDGHPEKTKKYSKGILDVGGIPAPEPRISGAPGHGRRMFASGRAEAAKEKELFEKIGRLEDELRQARQERDSAVEQNKKQIHELNAALLSIKARMEKFIRHKKEKRKGARKNKQ